MNRPPMNPPYSEYDEWVENNVAEHVSAILARICEQVAAAQAAGDLPPALAEEGR